MSIATRLAATMALGAFGLAAASCAPPPPPPHAVAMEKLPPPPEAVRGKLKLQVGGLGSVNALNAVTVSTDDPSLARVYAKEGGFSLIGKKVGSTVLHVALKDGSSQDVDVVVATGEPTTRGLGIGETFVVPMKGVKEYSVGLPDVVTTAITGDGSRLLVTGKKAGTTTLLLLESGGAQRSQEVTVVGGQRLD